jgi:hypothetical protein
MYLSMRRLTGVLSVARLYSPAVTDKIDITVWIALCGVPYSSCPVSVSAKDQNPYAIRETVKMK